MQTISARSLRRVSDPNVQGVFELMSTDGFMTICRPLGKQEEQFFRAFPTKLLVKIQTRRLAIADSFYGVELINRLCVATQELVFQSEAGDLLLSSDITKIAEETQYTVLGWLNRNSIVMPPNHGRKIRKKPQEDNGQPLETD